MTSASPGWQAGYAPCPPSRGSRRAVEIVGVVFAFCWFWPAAVAYLAWKLMGYPGLHDVRAMVDRGTSDLRAFRFAGVSGYPFAGSGNAAFDEYRRSEIERLEHERRRLDDEAREFRSFVDDLKRAKDREEFDSYMARRRQNGPTTA